MNNSVTEDGFRRIYVDSFCCFFALLTILILMELMRELEESPHRTGRIAVLSVMEGLALALSLATKFINMYVAAVVGLVFLVSVISKAVASRRNGLLFSSISLPIASGAVVALSTAVIFVALNPFLYHDPISHLSVMFHHRFTTMQFQARVIGPAVPNDILGRFTLIFKRGVLLDYRLSLPLKILFTGVCALGLAKSVRAAARDLAAGRLAGPYTVVFCWVFTTFIVNGSMMHVAWMRYFIPFVMCTSVLIAVGVDEIIDFIRARVG